MQFCPDYRAVSTSHGWRPSYRLFEGQRERLVPYKNGPRYFPTADDAREAAREYLRPHLNPPITAYEMPLERELSEVDRWRRRRSELAEAEKRQIFGESSPKTVFTKNGRQVEVEVKRRRA